MSSVGARGVPSTSGALKRLPVTGTVRDWENRTKANQGKVETAAIFNTKGEPLAAFQGNEHSVPFDAKLKDVEGATFTHYHPDKNFGGTLSLQDLKVFAGSKWNEIRAYAKTGQLYSLKANNNVNREGLRKWVNSNQKMLQKNFSNSYKSALKNATTPLKSGPHKGQVKLNLPNGKVKYTEPMTKAQAAAYARQYAVGMFERAYKKNLAKFGVTYTSTKGGITR